MRQNENTQNEIELERASYLLNLDDLNYEMLAEPLVVGNKPVAIPNTYIGVMGEINLVNVYADEYIEDKEFTKHLDTQSQINFPTRKFQQVRPATLEDELAGDTSY